MKESTDRGSPPLQASGVVVTCRGMPSAQTTGIMGVCWLTVCMTLRLGTYDPGGGEEHGERYEGWPELISWLRRLPLYKLTFKPE